MQTMLRIRHSSVYRASMPRGIVSTKRQLRADKNAQACDGQMGYIGSVRDDVPYVLGRPASTLKQWATEHSDALIAAAVSQHRRLAPARRLVPSVPAQQPLLSTLSWSASFYANSSPSWRRGNERVFASARATRRNKSPRCAFSLYGGGAETKALAQRARVMSDETRSKRIGSAMPCPRCGTIMDEVVRIAPVAGDPGLIGYECPHCIYVTSVFLQPHSGDHQRRDKAER